MTADLHTHGATLDGQYTPSELVKLAKDRGIEVLALIDHDRGGSQEKRAASYCSELTHFRRGRSEP